MHSICLSICWRALSCPNHLIDDLHFLHEGRLWPWLGWGCKSKSYVYTLFLILKTFQMYSQKLVGCAAVQLFNNLYRVMNYSDRTLVMPSRNGGGIWAVGAVFYRLAVQFPTDFTHWLIFPEPMLITALDLRLKPFALFERSSRFQNFQYVTLLKEICAGLAQVISVVKWKEQKESLVMAN